MITLAVLAISANELAIGLAILSLLGNIIQGVISSHKEKAIVRRNAERDETIAQIQADAKDLHEELDAARKEHAKVLKQNSLLRDRVTKLENTIQILGDELKRKEKIIKSLKAS